MRAAIYVRVSTTGQTCENQLIELRRYVAARGWQVHSEFADEGVSGAKESRPRLDAMLKDAKRRRFDVVCVWSLDRLGRSLKHLIAILDDLHGLNVTFISLREGLDLTTPSGRLQWQIIGAISEFERSRLAERVRAGLARVRSQGGRLGRPEKIVSETVLRPVRGLPIREAARRLGVSPATAHRWLSRKT